MAAVIPPGRWDHSDPREPIRDVAIGVPTVPADEHLFDVIVGCGEDAVREFVSFVERAKVAFGAATPGAHPLRGEDPALSEDLPSCMAVGEDPGPPAMPWWRCTVHREVRQGQRSTHDAHMEADEHAAAKHRVAPEELAQARDAYEARRRVRRMAQSESGRHRREVTDTNQMRELAYGIRQLTGPSAGRGELPDWVRVVEAADDAGFDPPEIHCDLHQRRYPVVSGADPTAAAWRHVEELHGRGDTDG